MNELHSVFYFPKWATFPSDLCKRLREPNNKIKYLTWSSSLTWQWNTEIFSACFATECTWSTELLSEWQTERCLLKRNFLAVCMSLYIADFEISCWVVMMNRCWLELHVLSLWFLHKNMDSMKCTYCYLFFERWCLISKLNYFVSIESNNKASNVLPLGFFSVLITIFPGIHQNFWITGKSVINHSLPYASY